MSSQRHHLNSNSSSTAQLSVRHCLPGRRLGRPSGLWSVGSHGHCRAAAVADNSAGQAVVRPLAALTIATGDGSGYTASVVL